MAGGWIKLSHDRSTPPRNLKWWMLTILPIGICQALAMVRVLASLSAFHIINKTELSSSSYKSATVGPTIIYLPSSSPLAHIYNCILSGIRDSGVSQLDGRFHSDAEGVYPCHHVDSTLCLWGRETRENARHVRKPSAL